MSEWLELSTTQGPARVRQHGPATGVPTRGTVLLGHGAGGLRDSPEMTALLRLVDLGWHVGLVEQPWRVAGKRLGPRPASLDQAWQEIIMELGALAPPVIHGGRSAGARVVCRTSPRLPSTLRPDGLLLISFPLHPPGKLERTRTDELSVAAQVPTLIVQGRRDPFGSPDRVRDSSVPSHQRVIPVAGTHSPDPSETLTAVAAWLAGDQWAHETLAPMEQQQ